MNYVQKQKNKIKRIFLAVLLFFAFGCILAGALLFGTPKAAHAESLALSSETNASLFLPESYEQYLALEKPSDVVLSDSYIAVADGKVLYIYDRTNNLYSKTDIPEQESSTITKIGFAGNRLFVSTRGGTGNHCYEYNFANSEGSKFDKFSFNCSTFCIGGDTLYTATVGGESTTFASYSIPDLKKDLTEDPPAHTLGTLNKQTTPSMTKLGDILYCTIGDQVYHIDPTSEQFSNSTPSFYLSSVTLDTKDVRSTCAHNNAFYYTADGGLYRAELSTTDNTAKKATCVLEGENFGTLTSYNGSLYCIRGQSILRFDPASEGTNYMISDYEISSSSASVGRLSGAKDVVRAGSLTVIADTENHRVTVYNDDTGAYSVLAPEDDESFSPTLVATDGTLVAAVSESKVYVCRDAKKNPTFEAPENLNNGTIVGIACVYGKVYYVTQNNIQGELNGQSATKSNDGTPFAMTSDLYGNLYVAYNDETVRVFTEEQFIAQSKQGNKIEGVTVPKEAKSLRADFKGNLYYLNANGNFCNNNGICATVNGANFVYHSETNVTPTSFALGFEDDAVSFLFGDFIVTSHEGALGFPTLSTIDASSAYDAISQVQAKEEVTLLDVKEDAIGVRVDLQQLNSEAAYFPYTSYGRNPAQERAVLLTATENGDYNLVALYEGKSYRVELFRTSDCLTDPVPVWTGETGERYLSCEAHLYNFPCLTAARSEEKLPRGSKVTLLDVVQADGDKTDELDLGLDFAYIQVETRERTVCTAYLPLSFLSELDPNGMEREDFTLGTLKKDILLHGVENSEESFTVKKGEQVRLYDNGDGTFTVKTEQDGVLYQGQVEKSLISRGESDALRIALIVILTVLAVLIVGAYVFLLSGRKKKS